MSNETENVLSTEDQEILQLQNALAASRKRKSEALELQRQKAETELQNRIAQEAKKRADDILAYEKIVAAHEEKRRLAREAEEAAKREEAQKRKALEDEGERIEQIQRTRAAHERKCAELADAARREELEAEAILRDLRHVNAPVVVDPEINVKTGPMAFVWRTEDGPRVAPAEPAKPLPVAEPVQIETRKEDPQEIRSEERRVGKECRSRWSPY